MDKDHSVAARGDTIQSVERCFAVLEAFEGCPPEGMSMARLAEATSLPRPVVRRLLLTLAALGYVTSSGPRWWLAPPLQRLGGLFAESSPLVRIAGPHAAAAARKLDEPVVLGQRAGQECLIVAVARVEHLATVRADIGQRLPLHATAMGQVLLAWGDGRWPGELRRYTPHTLSEAPLLEQRLARVRRNGFALASQEIELGLTAVAVPIWQDGHVTGALNVAAPDGRLSPARMQQEAVPVLMEAAAAISAGLSGG